MASVKTVVQQLAAQIAEQEITMGSLRMLCSATNRVRTVSLLRLVCGVELGCWMQRGTRTPQKYAGNSQNTNNDTRFRAKIIYT